MVEIYTYRLENYEGEEPRLVIWLSLYSRLFRRKIGLEKEELDRCGLVIKK